MYQPFMPQYQQYQPRQDYRPIAPQTAGFTCLPVTSRAEAEVSQIPFDGSTSYFVDTANGKIYAKKFNAETGAAPLITFSREVETAKPQYVTTEDFEKFKDELEKRFKPARKEKKDESD